MSPIRFLLCLAAALWLIGHVPARASGFYLPAPVEWLLWLIATPAGWAVLGIVAGVLVAAVIKLARRGDRE